MWLVSGVSFLTQQRPQKERAPQAGAQGDYDSVLLKTVPQAQKQIQKYSEELDHPHNESIENTLTARPFPGYWTTQSVPILLLPDSAH